MKLAYFDCASGISGDMTLGALVDLGIDLAAIQAGIDSLGLTNCRFHTEEVKKKGFRATQLTVRHEPEHAHRHLHHITEMIDAGSLSPRQKELAVRMFTRLAQAEAKVHGTTLEKVHFHEVGAVDSIADIVGSAIALDMLAVDRIFCSPIPTGHGFIQIAHGRCSIPAPATGELLQGIPLAASEVEAELTTPTGAAIVSTVVDEFGTLPAMNIESIGYGAGQRDLEEQANLLRLVVGHADEHSTIEQLQMLETNLDDVSSELIGHCISLLTEAGALDVFTTPIGMKKNRPGVMLSVLCDPSTMSQLEMIIFQETSTLGIRRRPVSRHTLKREPCLVETPWGPLQGKLARLPNGSTSFSPEYEACRRIASEHQLPLHHIYQTAHKAFDKQQQP